MKLGISWVPDDLGSYGDLVARTEAIGIDRIGVPQAGRYRECHVTLTHLFHHTSRVEAGPVVSKRVLDRDEFLDRWERAVTAVRRERDRP